MQAQITVNEAILRNIIEVQDHYKMHNNQVTTCSALFKTLNITEKDIPRIIENIRKSNGNARSEHSLINLPQKVSTL